MLNSIEDRLKARYGQARFNPAGGQSQMTFQEWLDRHPGLTGSQNYNEADARGKYEKAVSKEGGEAYQAANPDWATKEQAAPDIVNRAQIDNAGNATFKQQVAMPGGPDTPPNAAQAAAKRRLGTYGDFVKKHGGQSTANLAGKYRQATGGKVTDKMKTAMKTTDEKRDAARAKKAKVRLTP